MNIYANGKKIKAARAHLGISIRELARRCGLNQSTISRHEIGLMGIGRIAAARYEKGTKGLLKKEDLLFGE